MKGCWWSVCVCVCVCAMWCTPRVAMQQVVGRGGWSLASRLQAPASVINTGVVPRISPDPSAERR